jgi:hypothetical protein
MRTHDRRPGSPLGVVAVAGIAAVLLSPTLPARGAEPRRPNLQGTWTLDPDLTARLSKDQPGREGDDRGGNGADSRHRQGLGSVGPIGGGGHDELGIGDYSPARERHEAELRREVVASLDSLTIAQQAGQVTITDQDGHARVLKTDGSKIRDQGPAGPAQLRARWDEDGSLVVEVKPDKGTRRTESYVVSNDGKHLYLTVTIAGQAGQILRAYDPVPLPAAR